MMRGERGASGQSAAQAGRFHHRDTVAPSEEMPAHLVEAASLETHGQRAVRMIRWTGRDGTGMRLHRRTPASNCNTVSTGDSWNTPNDRSAKRCKSTPGRARTFRGWCELHSCSRAAKAACRSPSPSGRPGTPGFRRGRRRLGPAASCAAPLIWRCTGPFVLP